MINEKLQLYREVDKLRAELKNNQQNKVVTFLLGFVVGGLVSAVLATLILL